MLWWNKFAVNLYSMPGCNPHLYWLVSGSWIMILERARCLHPDLDFRSQHELTSMIPKGKIAETVRAFLYIRGHVCH